LFFVALAADYDGTLALDGKVDEPTIEALRELKASGRKLVLVTGRDLADLRKAFNEMALFDLVVAENGALLFDPANEQENPLGKPPPPAFVARLRELGVAPLTVGRSIVATWEPNETLVLKAIRDLGLELHIIFNKGAVMVLQSDINKASGLKQALKLLGLSRHNVVGIGDAENDQAFLGACGCSVAVANALETVKERADLVVADHGRGVAELAKLLTEADLAVVHSRVDEAQPVLGTREDNTSIRLTRSETVLVTGSSGGGKSTIVTALLEQMREAELQFCVIDPEGDYAELREAIVVGDAKREPSIAEAIRLLSKPANNVVLNLVAIDPGERPPFLAAFLPELAKLRARSGRPHWIVVDEVHHCLPAKWEPAPVTLPRELPAMIAVTVHADAVSHDFLALVSTVVGVGEGAGPAIMRFWQALDRPQPSLPERTPAAGRILVVRGGVAEVLIGAMPKERQRRHIRKYAEGELGQDKSFYFRGPEGALKLRAQNLSTFLDLAAGVDDQTWMYHLREGAYSKWFREAIKDELMAAEAASVERNAALSALESRARIKAAVQQRYTVPAKKD